MERLFLFAQTKAPIITDIWIKTSLIVFNLLGLLFVNISETMTLIDKGGVLAILIIISYVLFKIVKTQYNTIKEMYEERLQEKDKLIKELEELLKKK